MLPSANSGDPRNAATPSVPLRSERTAAPLPLQQALAERVVAVSTLDERPRVTRAGAAALNASLLARATTNMSNVAGVEAAPLDKDIAEELGQLDIVVRWATEQQQGAVRRCIACDAIYAKALLTDSVSLVPMSGCEWSSS